MDAPASIHTSNRTAHETGAACIARSNVMKVRITENTCLYFCRRRTVGFGVDGTVAPIVEHLVLIADVQRSFGDPAPGFCATAVDSSYFVLSWCYLYC